MAHCIPVALVRLPPPVEAGSGPVGLVAHSYHQGSTSGGEFTGERRCGRTANMPANLAKLMPMVRKIQHMWAQMSNVFAPRAVSNPVLGNPLLGKKVIPFHGLKP